MRIKLFILCLSLVLCPAYSLFAESLQDVYRLTLLRNEHVRIQDAKIGQVRAERRAMLGTVLPQVNVLLTESYQDSSGGLSSSGASGAFTASRRPDYKISVTQPLYSGFRDQHALRALDAQIRKEVLVLDQVKRLLFSQVATAYLQVLLFENEARILRQSAQALQSRITELQGRAAIGKSKNSDVLTTQTQLYRINAQEIQAWGRATQARLALANLTGQDMEKMALSEIVVSEPKEPMNLSKLTNRTEVLALKEDVAYFEYTKKAAKGAHLPVLSVGGNYYLKRIDFLSPIKWDAALTLAIPLYHGGSDSAKVAEAEAQLTQIQNELAHKTREVFIDIESSYAAFQSAKSQESALKLAAQKSEQGYHATASEYRLGLASNLDVMQALNAALDIKRELNAAKNQLMATHIQFKISLQELP